MKNIEKYSAKRWEPFFLAVQFSHFIRRSKFITKPQVLEKMLKSKSDVRWMSKLPWSFWFPPLSHVTLSASPFHPESEPSLPHRPAFCTRGWRLWCSGCGIVRTLPGPGDGWLQAKDGFAGHGYDERCSYYWYNAGIESIQTGGIEKNLKVLPIEQLETERGKSSKFPLDLHESAIWFRIFDTHCDALILQKLHALGMSHELPSEVSINALWLKKHFRNWISFLYSLRGQKLQVAIIDVPCPRRGVWRALFLLQNCLMSFRASPKTQGASTGPEKGLGHGLDTLCGLVGPSLTQEHSLRIAFYVAWCTMWSNVCTCRYHLSHSQLLLATHAI